MEGNEDQGAASLAWSYRPALTALLLLVTPSEPLAQEEAPPPRGGTGRGAVGPGRIFVAGWRDLDGGELQVLLGTGAPGGAIGCLPLALHVLHASHLEALAPQGGA